MLRSTVRLTNLRDIRSPVSVMTKKIVLYDGVCNLCNAGVRKVIQNDPKRKFSFASMQSKVGKKLLKDHKYTEEEGMNRFVLVEQVERDGKIIKSSATNASTAALLISRDMSMPYPLLYPLIIVPKFIRDFVYDIFAQSRYRLFGKTVICQMPSKNVRDRFIDIKEEK